MKRVQDLIIGSTFDATVTMANFASKAVGAVNIIDPATGIAWATGGESAVIARVCTDSDGRFYVRQSLPLTKRQIRSYLSKDYAAATPKIMTLDLAGIAATASLGDVHELWITDYKDSNYIVPRRRIAYEAAAGDTPTLVAVGLAAAINADVSLPNVTATSATTVVTITGAAVDGSGNVINDFRPSHEILFNLGLGENIGAGVTAITQVASKGCGTSREILKLEEIYKGYRGYANRVWNSNSMSNIQYDVDTTTPGTYDVTTIMHDQPFHTNLEGSVPAQVSTIIAMLEAAGDAFETALDLVMAELQ